MALEGITQNLATFVATTTFNDLPESVIDTSKKILLDSIGCALGGYVVDRGRIASELAEFLGGNPQAHIIGNRKTSSALAAFTNAELIKALDYDPVGPLCPHVVPHVIASSLAIAELVNASGKDLITAIAVGLESGGRVANSMASYKIPKKAPPYYEDAPTFSYTKSIFGGAAGTCKILGFDAVHVANTLGVVGASTPVPAGMKWEHILPPHIMLKNNCWFGWMAQLAVTATLAVERGFTGDTNILDGEHGFWQIYGSPFFHPDKITDNLGKVWNLDKVSFKPYPSCFPNHLFIEGINTIVEQNKIKPEDIESIIIQGDIQLQYPNRRGDEVWSSTDTQTVVSYAAAIAAYYGAQPGPYWELPTTFNDQRIRSLMKKVKMTLHPEAEKVLSENFRTGQSIMFCATIVEIKAKGHAFSAEVAIPKGHYLRPLTEEELKKKFRNNASYSMLRSNKIEPIITMINKLEEVDNVEELTKLIAVV